MVQLEFDFPTPLYQLNTELAEIMDSIATLCTRRDTVKSKIHQLHNIASLNAPLVPTCGHYDLFHLPTHQTK
jgi:hypothetical protein